MKWFDFTFDMPAENLACDEALLDLCEREGVEILRFWESHQHFVALGYGNRVASEVNVEECQRRGIPILRRCSGGGTVVQGPGCLNYNLTLRIPESGPLTTVTGTNEFVMERNRTALEGILAARVSVQGHTDLAFANKVRRAVSAPGVEGTDGSRRGEDTAPHPRWFKFSGNAQRRRRHALMFHGAILYDFDLSLIDALLRFPSAQPDYRASRSHAEFVRNIAAAPVEVKQALQLGWEAAPRINQLPSTRLRELVENQYTTDAWNLRR